MADPREPLLVIAGPTATGKTSVAIELARHFDGELVGADSVQVYRDFDIGAAKPTAEELGELRHHLIDVVDPDEDIDAAEYARRADRAIERTRSRNRLPIVVGGTGLWIRALLRGLVDLPPVDPKVRRALESAVESEGSAALHSRLERLDPLTARSVHPNDALRVIRALEVLEQTGSSLGMLRAKHALGEPRYRAVFIVLDVDRDAHGRLIEARVRDMLDRGWIDEVRALRAKWRDDVRPFGSVGYREMLAHVRDGVPLDDTLRQIRKSTRTYARRQRTWFRGEPGVSFWAARSEIVMPRALERIARDLNP